MIEFVTELNTYKFNSIQDFKMYLRNYSISLEEDDFLDKIHRRFGDFYIQEF